MVTSIKSTHFTGALNTVMASNDQKVYIQGLTASGVPYDQAIQIVSPAPPVPTAQQVERGPLLFQPQDPKVGDGWITTPPSGSSDLYGGRGASEFRGFLNDSRQQSNMRDLGDGKDWRVRISLGEGSDKLYNDGNSGILEPLKETDGVIFPYTPSIQTNYVANYNSTDLTHSNMRANFYQGSKVEDIQITGTFTAQSTKEADYMLAAIHFFKATTKMFYGQDPNKGTPPPLVFLSGLGDNQFANHPCAVAQFNYVTPNDVDYVRTSGGGARVSLGGRRARRGQSSPLGRLLALFGQGIPRGAESTGFQPVAGNLDRDNTYVPTKLDLAVTLIPMQSRSRQSSEFSLKDWGSGELNRRGMW